MKCPECSHDQKVKSGMRCGRCRYDFVFHPKQRPKISDGLFLAAVRKASANGTYAFTRNQLLAQLRGRIAGGGTSEKAALVGMALLTVGFLFVPALRIAAVFTALVFLIIAASRGSQRRTAASPDLDELTIGRWLATKGPIEGLLLEPSLHEPPPDWEESDMYDYGVERVLFVQHDLQVDQLVLNGLHAEERALVVAESGYPGYLVPRVAALLAENLELPVFALHDPSREGRGMIGRLRSDARFGLGDRRIIDLGLSPADVAKLPNLRKNHPGQEAADIPVDAILFPTLALGLGGALAGSMALGSLLDQSRSKQNAGHDTHFG